MTEESSQESSSVDKPLHGVVKAGLFLLGFAGTHGLFLALTISNFLGFRGSPGESNPFARENAQAADLMVWVIIGLFVAVMSIYRRERKLPSAFVYGMWLGMGVSLAVIFLR